LWLVVMGIPAIIFGSQNTPWMLVYTFGTIMLMLMVSGLWYNYIKKGEDDV